MKKPHRLMALIAALRAAKGHTASAAGREACARRVASCLADPEWGMAPEFLNDIEAIWSEDNVDAALGRLVGRMSTVEAEGSADQGVILIVEDDRLTARIHAEAVSGLESDVVIAENAAAAELLLRQHKVSIVLLDLVLPDGDGRDLLVRIRAAAATRDVPIVVTTARVDPATQAECYALGADTLLTKPVSPDLLAAVVGGQLDHAAELRIAGRVDRLTGLANRAALTDTLEHLAPLAIRTRNPLSIAMVDIDYFKSVNDTYGHDVGDRVLKQTARTLANTLRSSDLVARWGGEEFCIAFPDTNTSGAVSALTNALEAVRNLVFEANDEKFAVTFSAGVTQVAAGISVAESMTEADRLMYFAKKSGRNRVCSAMDEAAAPRPRVLLVEDDDAVGDTVASLLRREGFDVLRHADGQNALRSIESEHFVLAVVDLNLPEVDGFELIGRLRALPISAKMPAIMLSGSAEEENIVRGFEIGANDYVTKPFQPRELMARVNRLVARR